MKKIILCLFILIITIAPVFSFTDEEFKEVYTALVESTEIIEEQQSTINELKAQLSELVEKTNILVNDAEKAKIELERCKALLNESQINLEKSNKIINKLNNQKIIIGVGCYFVDFNSIGVKVNLGYKFFNIGFIGVEVGKAKENFITSIAYSIFI